MSVSIDDYNCVERSLVSAIMIWLQFLVFVPFFLRDFILFLKSATVVYSANRCQQVV